MSAFTEDLVNVSGIRITRLMHSSSVLYASLVHRRILIFFFVHREHTKNMSICSGENTWRCSQSVTFWYSKKGSEHVKIILSEGVSIQISLIFLFFFSLKESITELTSTPKSRWIWIRANKLSLVSVIVARRNVFTLFMELKDFSAVAVVTRIVKRTVRIKEMMDTAQHPKHPMLL